MRPSKSFSTILLNNSNGLVQYVPTPPLPPSVTDKPWGQRPHDRQPHAVKSAPQSADRSANSGNSDHPIPRSPDHPIQKWTWTLIQTGNQDSPDRHVLRRSPQGQLLLEEQLVYQPYTIVAEGIDRQIPAEPNSQSPPSAPSRPMVSVQIGTHTYIAAYTLPDGRPELPSTHEATYHALQKRDGSWCFLPNAYTMVPEMWQPSLHSSPVNPVTADLAGVDLPASPTAKSALDSQPGNQKLEVEPPVPEAANPPQPVTKTEETEQTNDTHDTSSSDHQITRSQACTEVRRSDHPIPPSPPIPEDPAADDEPDCTPEDVLHAFEELISNYLVCSPHQQVILALWILHTYCYRRTSFLTPYLNIYSPVEQSGKSTCLAFLRACCADPWLASGVSPSTLTRKIIADRPTVLLDNWHTTFRGRDQQQITGFLLNGCRDFQPFTFLEKGSLREVDAYCPKAFADMASLPPTLAQRSIPIVLQRCLPHEKVSPPVALFSGFVSWAQQWIGDHVDKINCNTANSDHRESLAALSPHQQACAQPLLGLAQTIGGEWPQRARAALLEVFREEQERQPSPVQLLSDIRDAFAQHHHPERIFTAELLQYLHNLDHRTWYEWSKGQPMNAHALSALLRNSFHIYPRTQRRDKQKLRGYQKADFADAWNRYLPAQNLENSKGNTAADGPVQQESALSDVDSGSQACTEARRSDGPITRSPGVNPKSETECNETLCSERGCNEEEGKRTIYAGVSPVCGRADESLPQHSGLSERTGCAACGVVPVAGSTGSGPQAAALHPQG